MRAVDGIRTRDPKLGKLVPAPERFDRFVCPEPNTGCWLWLGTHNSKGYPCFSAERSKSVLAHRWAYTHFVRAFPRGLTIDHLCNVKSCVNPGHLEPKTAVKNIARAVLCQPKTRCIRGHLFRGKNLQVRPNGGRRCLACRPIQARAFWRRRATERRNLEAESCPACLDLGERCRQHQPPRARRLP